MGVYFYNAPKTMDKLKAIAQRLVSQSHGCIYTNSTQSNGQAKHTHRGWYLIVTWMYDITALKAMGKQKVTPKRLVSHSHMDVYVNSTENNGQSRFKSVLFSSVHDYAYDLPSYGKQVSYS